MFKSLITIIAAAVFTLSLACTAFATFADLELIRVYYDRAGVELATDLGNINTLVNSASPASTPTTTIPGSFSTAVFATYFALDRDNGHLWASNVDASTATFIPAIIGGSTGLTSIKSGTTFMYNTYNPASLDGINYSGLASHSNSYKNKISATQGWFGNTITSANNARTFSELNLTTLATQNTQTLYYWANSLTTVASEKSGVAVATITTNADGSTTISAPPAAATSPGIPTNVTATASGDGQATVTFTAPDSNGGSTIIDYTVTSNDGKFATGTTSPITVAGLTNGTTYTFTVTARNSVGSSLASAASNSVTPAAATTVPGAPTIGTATAGNTQATVAFTAPDSNGGSAIIDYTVTSNDGKTATGTTSPITVTGLSNGTAYTFTITARNSVGSSVASAASNSVTPTAATTVPGAPTIGAATAGNAQATVSFTSPDSNGGSIIIDYTVTSNDGKTATGTTSPITVTGLTNGTAYTFTVTTRNSVGSSLASAASNSVTPTAATTVPGAPTIGAATAGNAQATVSFTTPDSNGGSAIIDYTVTSNDGKFATGTTSPITVTGLTNGTAYTFTVTARNSVGSSVASAASNSVTPAAATTVPGAPTIGTATAGNAQATVSFTAPASNGGSVIIDYTVTSNDGKTATGTASPITVTGLTNGTSYTFTVTARNSVGSSLASAVSNSVTPAAVPGAPTIGTATAGNAQATVSFTAPALSGGSTITGYTVTSIPAGGVDSNAGTISSLSHVVTGLTNGTAYTFTVKATNTVGTGPASAASNSVTPSAAITVPGAPAVGTATAGNTQATVTFTAPASNGGSSIIDYTVTANDGKTATGTTSPITITGLINGAAYTFTVTARNSAGSSPASAASNRVTPSVTTTIPGAPAIGSATTGNAQATVSFTAPAADGGSSIIDYTVTANDGKTATGTTSPITVTGLTNGTAYTFTVTARNSSGPSLASAASNSVTPVTVPGAPTIGTATAGNAQATVSFTAPASNGGSVILDYTVTYDGKTVTGTASPITVTGLTNGSSYTFTVTARNSAGSSVPSVASNSVTPAGLTDQIITFGTKPTVVVGGTGTVTATGGASGNPVTFSTTTSSACSVTTVNGVTTVTGITAGADACTITANQAGNASYNAATPVTQTISIIKSNQTIGTITFTPAALTVGGSTTASAAGGSSGNTVVFSSKTTDVCTVTSAIISGITAGTCTIAADQAGNAAYNAATQVSQSITVVKSTQTISTITFTPATLSVGISTAVNSTGGASGNPVTFTSKTPAVCTTSGVNGTTVTGVTPGTCTIAADQAGNATFNAATQVTQNINVTAIPTIKFTVTPVSGTYGSMLPATNQTVEAGAKFTFVVTPNTGYQIASVTGCDGTLNGAAYTTSGIIRDCTVTAAYVPIPTLKGDLNNSGRIDMADALLALQIAIGLRTPSVAELAAGDVAPIVSGRSTPDGKIDIADAVAILQKAVGALSW